MAARWRIEFYQTAGGGRPVQRWLARLAPAERRAVRTAVTELLQLMGPGICSGPWGKNLGGGLFELRVARRLESGAESSRSPTAREPRMLLRVFCHAHGDRVVVLLGGYDKLRRPKKGEQQRQIALARRRLADFLSRRG